MKLKQVLQHFKLSIFFIQISRWISFDHLAIGCPVWSAHERSVSHAKLLSWSAALFSPSLQLYSIHKVSVLQFCAEYVLSSFGWKFCHKTVLPSATWHAYLGISFPSCSSCFASFLLLPQSIFCISWAKNSWLKNCHLWYNSVKMITKLKQVYFQCEKCTQAMIYTLRPLHIRPLWVATTPSIIIIIVMSVLADEQNLFSYTIFAWFIKSMNSRCRGPIYARKVHKNSFCNTGLQIYTEMLKKRSDTQIWICWNKLRQNLRYLWN